MYEIRVEASSEYYAWVLLWKITLKCFQMYNVQIKPQSRNLERDKVKNFEI